MKLYEYDTQATKYNNLNWKTDKILWSQFTQVKNNHVRPARGIIVGNDVWVDHYAVLGSLSHLERYLRDEYGDEYDVMKDNGEVIMWRITGNPTLSIEYPGVNDLSGHQVGMVKMLAEEMKIPPTASLSWDDGDNVAWRDINELLYA